MRGEVKARERETEKGRGGEEGVERLRGQKRERDRGKEGMREEQQGGREEF